MLELQETTKDSIIQSMAKLVVACSVAKNKAG
jgi:hypothetical protein